MASLQLIKILLPALLFSLSIHASYGENEETGAPPCLICENGTMEQTSALIQTAEGTFSCIGLMGAGEMGMISEESCAATQKKADYVCGCDYGITPKEEMGDVDVSIPDLPADVDSEEVEITEDNGDEASVNRSGETVGVCQFCADNEVMTSPDHVTNFLSGQHTCSELQQLAIDGNIVLPRCIAIQEDVRVVCGCVVPDPMVETTQSTTVAATTTTTTPPTTGDAVATTVTTVSAVEDVTGSYCGVCTGTIINPEAILEIEFNGANSTTCQEIMDADEARSLTPSDCSRIKYELDMFDACGCVDDLRSPVAMPISLEAPSVAPTEGTTEVNIDETNSTQNSTGEAIDEETIASSAEPTTVPSTTPSSTPTEAPTFSPTEAPRLPCGLCAGQHSVSLLNATFNHPLIGTVTCEEVADLAVEGTKTTEECSALRQAVDEVCPCTTDAPTQHPSSVPSQSPSQEPSVAPSESPSTQPSSSPSQTPTESTAPSEQPSAAPTYIVEYEDCFTDLTKIYRLERNVADASITRVYTLCPETIFSLGNVQNDGTVIEGQAPLQFRPNVIYQCGEDGKRSNNCIVRGGDFALLSFYGAYGDMQEVVENTHVRGLTFDAQKVMSVVLKSAGDTTFVDCAFINQANLVPILLQWQGDAPPRDSRSKSRYPADASGRSSATDESVAATSAIQELSHDVTFRGCLFQDNRAIENLSYPGIIENTHQSNLVIDNCLFDKNEYDDVENPAPRGYAIRTSGDLSVKNSCFVDNSFRSTAAILSFSDAGVQASMNHVQSRQSTVLQCNFIAAYGSGQMEPVCTPSDVDFCAYEALSTSSPTQSPSETPDETGTDDASKSSSYRARLSMPATCLLIASTLFAANGLVTALLQM